MSLDQTTLFLQKEAEKRRDSKKELHNQKAFSENIFASLSLESIHSEESVEFVHLSK